MELKDMENVDYLQKKMGVTLLILKIVWSLLI